jgi:UDP-N-acetylmuramyl tripeptide synthase
MSPELANAQAVLMASFLSLIRNIFLFCPKESPASISFNISSGFSLRGLSDVKIVLSLLSQATCAISALFVLSLSPPQPITVIICSSLLRNCCIVAKTVGDTRLAITSLCIDSRKVVAGAVFIAIKGTLVDGHEYIAKAIALGASAVVCEFLPNTFEENIVYIQVKDSTKAAGEMAAAFYDFPSQSMQVVGVTGTNGKTTVTTLLFQLFTKLGFQCGLISTVQNFIGTAVETSTHTTPDAISIQSLLAKMRDAGCSYVFMEVSSHAIDQNRIQGVKFAGAVFTNITHDHLLVCFMPFSCNK